VAIVRERVIEMGESIDQSEPLTDEEEAGILDGLAELDAGRGFPLADACHQIMTEQGRS
jgi:predicted transcriptional regulator